MYYMPKVRPIPHIVEREYRHENSSSTLCCADDTVEETDLDIRNIVNTDEEINFNISGQDPRWCRDLKFPYQRLESQKFRLWEEGRGQEYEARART